VRALGKDNRVGQVPFRFVAASRQSASSYIGGWNEKGLLDFSSMERGVRLQVEQWSIPAEAEPQLGAAPYTRTMKSSATKAL